jgi:hypothetical protein
MLGAIIGSVAGGLLSSSASKKAAAAQERSAQAQIDLQREIYDDTTQRFQPFYDSGRNYQNALNFELLGGDRPMIAPSGMEIIEGERVTGRTKPKFGGGGEGGDWLLSPAQDIKETYYSVGDQDFDTRGAAQSYINSQGTPYQGFEASPGYNYLVTEAERALEGAAAAGGNLYSAGTLKALQEQRIGLAQQERGNYLNRLTQQAGQGQAAAANQANAGMNFASGASNALANMGDAQAAGYIGSANAINQGISNALGAWQYAQGGGGGFGFNPGGGGSWMNGLFG